MNARKQKVILAAHELFVNRGIQATSIQDILEYSGISKGTFYNYFSSKNELLMAIFKVTYAELERQRKEVLIGKDPADIEIFISQVELQMKTNRKNNLITLFEEVLSSNDEDLKEYIEKTRLKNIQWVYERFLDIFGNKQEPYLLDCAIMFMGILRENIKFSKLATSTNININRVVRYSVNRIVKVVDEVAQSQEQLIDPEFLERWLPDCKKPNHNLQKKLHDAIHSLKQSFHQLKEPAKPLELLDFLEDELLNSKSPRKYLLESAFSSIKTIKMSISENELKKLEQLMEEFLNHMEKL